MTDPRPVDDDVDLFHQMSVETTSCYWCGQWAVGTARDEDGRIRYSCGQKGHGKA